MPRSRQKCVEDFFCAAARYEVMSVALVRGLRPGEIPECAGFLPQAPQAGPNGVLVRAAGDVIVCPQDDVSTQERAQRVVARATAGASHGADRGNADLAERFGGF